MIAENGVKLVVTVVNSWSTFEFHIVSHVFDNLGLLEQSFSASVTQRVRGPARPCSHRENIELLIRGICQTPPMNFNGNECSFLEARKLPYALRVLTKNTCSIKQ